MFAKSRAICFVTFMALLFSGCSIVSDIHEPIDTVEVSPPAKIEYSTEEPYTDKPISDNSDALDEEEFWELIQKDIDSLFAEYNLFVFRVDTRAPYINYYVEFGLPSTDGTYTPIWMSKDECAATSKSIQNKLIELISMYHLEEGDSFWDAPKHSAIGLFIYNRFLNTSFTPNEIDRLCVSDYQIDLLEFYSGTGTGEIMSYFDGSLWDKYEPYTP